MYEQVFPTEEEDGRILPKEASGCVLEGERTGNHARSRNRQTIPSSLAHTMDVREMQHKSTDGIRRGVCFGAMWGGARIRSTLDHRLIVTVSLAC